MLPIHTNSTLTIAFDLTFAARRGNLNIARTPGMNLDFITLAAVHATN